MTTATILKLIVAGAGILLLFMDFSAFARKRMNETIGLGWALFGIVLILVGLVPGLSGWSSVMADGAYAAFFLIIAAIILGIFGLSMSISVLLMKNQELAMQVSLLNQENERMLGELENLTGKSRVNL